MPLQELLKAYPQEERLRQAYQEILQEIETQTSNIEGEPVNIIILKDKYKLKLTSHNKNPITINYPFNKPKSFKITGSIAYLAIKEETKISEFREWGKGLYDRLYEAGIINLKDSQRSKATKWLNQFLRCHKHWLSVTKQQISLKHHSKSIINQNETH